MAWSGNILYTARFKGKTGKFYLIEIRKSGYAGVASEIVNLAPTPLTYKHIDVEGSNIQGTEMNFSFIVNKSAFDTYDLLTQGTDFDYKFQLFDNFDDSGISYPYNPMWEGWVLPAETSRAFFDANTVYSITISDYLSLLKNYAFSDINGNIPMTRITALDMISLSLQKITGLTGAASMSIQTGITEAHMGVNAGIGYAYIHPRNFCKKKNTLIVPDNCFDVINNILSVFNCRLFAPVNEANSSSSAAFRRFYLLNLDEVSSPLYQYQDSNNDGYLSWYHTGTNNSAINLDAYTFLLESELSRQMPIKALELIQHNYDAGTVVDAIDFNDMDNAAIWTPTNLGVSQTGEINNFTIAAATTGNIITLNGYTLTSDNGNAYIRVNFTIKNTTVGTTIVPLLIWVQVIRTNGTGETRTDILPLIMWGRTYNYISPASRVFQVQHGSTYKIKVVITNASLVSGQTFSLTNVNYSKYYSIDGNTTDSVLFDYLFEAWTIDGALSDKTIETKIGDSDKITNDSSITYSASINDLTSDWHRYGIDEHKSIQELLMQTYFNRFGGNPRILKLKVVDPEDTISLKNKITLAGITYNILDIERDFVKGIVSLRMQQVSITDITMTMIRKEIANPNNSGSSSTGVAGGVTNVISMPHKNLSGLESNDHLQYLLRNPATYQVATATSISPNLDLYDVIDVTALASALTISNPTGTLANKRKLLIDILDNGTARALTWGTDYIAGGVALPTTTTISKQISMVLIYDITSAKWKLRSLAQE